MEVLITKDNGDELIYWVSLENLPEDSDEYDWAVDAAVKHHNAQGADMVSVDEAEACEPFSRYESEFTLI